MIEDAAARLSRDRIDDEVYVPGHVRVVVYVKNIDELGGGSLAYRLLLFGCPRSVNVRGLFCFLCVFQHTAELREAGLGEKSRCEESEENVSEFHSRLHCLWFLRG